MARARNKETGLTDKQELFAEALAFNPEMSTSDCYRAAYNSEGMKPSTIHSTACVLKDDPKVAARVSELRAERSERTGIDADWVLMRLAEEATADVADIYSDSGALLPVKQWPKIWRQGLITGLDSHQEYAYEGGQKIPDGIVQKIKISDRVKRLELIGKHVNVGAFKDKVEHSGSIGIADILDSIDGTSKGLPVDE